MTPQVLVVEQSASNGAALAELITNALPFHACERAGLDTDVRARLRESSFKLIVLVLNDPDRELNIFERFESFSASAPTLAIVPASSDVESMGRIWRKCDDFLLLPVRADELRCRLQRLIERRPGSVAHTHEHLVREIAVAGLIGRDEAFLASINKIPILARCNGPVLITGETGTGKELCARAIHMLGPRREFPFIPVDCASLPDTLFENELFGHVNGAFTDARTEQKGLLALADNGTLFLDEIDALSLHTQAKLLRFLQERTYRALGSDRITAVKVNIVAATNSNLREMVRKGQFRSDLFFRLDVFRLQLVPLRERGNDVVLLAQHFLDIFCTDNKQCKKTLVQAAVHKLRGYDWPGNVRELYNVIQRAVFFSEGAEILPCHLDGIPEPAASSRTETFRESRLTAIEAFERRYIEKVLNDCSGNITRAASLAQHDRRAFARLVKRYKLKDSSV